MFKIQRVPRGLNELLSIQGGATPVALLEHVHGVIDLLPLYGLSQLQVQTANNAALAENGNVAVVVPNNQWWILFNCHGTFVKTATATALRGDIELVIGGNRIQTRSEELGPFGATETGNCRVCYEPSQPRLLPPASEVRAVLAILGTDATANVSINAMVGVLAA